MAVRVRPHRRELKKKMHKNKALSALDKKFI